ncbi:hypothetical protein OHS17_18590 [Streptomyces sp. NBC_00523]|uniref:hypothetical protein n=1 Tax=Streptomyces sp. NBC_00523 TaxID=2975765 RepID=UPI002E7FB9AB|nr:hypothetical protein [Streptomyces sp. NBC_00523]WUD01517.1 hypothetical protein OHS17_18590 [Streptomyces sp. NBC_00523]
MIQPGGIPQYTGDFAQLEKAASGLRTHALGIRTSGKDVHSRFQATAGYYKAPEADQLFSSTQPVMDTAEEFATDIESLADALDTFIHEAKPHADRLKQLKLDAIDFVHGVEGDDDWTEDQKKLDEHQALMDDVATAQDGFHEAERKAANVIEAISPAMSRPRWTVDDGSHGPRTYGPSEDLLAGMKNLPWGSPEDRTYERWSLGWWGHGAKSWAWEGLAKDSIWGGIDGLGTLVGFHGEKDRDEAWDGLRRTAVGGYAYGMDALGQGEHLSDWQRESEAYAKEFAKQLVAYDVTPEDPARGHAIVSFNLLTLFAGPLGVAAKLGKGGTFAKAAGTVARIGDALDPLGGAFRAAKALSDLPKVSQVLANVSDHLRIPASRFPDGVLDLDHRYRIDKDGNFVPLDREGNPHLEPARHEPTAEGRTGDEHPARREPAAVGGHAPDATTHAGEGLPPRGGRDAGHVANADAPGSHHTDGEGDGTHHTADSGPAEAHAGHDNSPAPPSDIDPAKYSKDIGNVAQAQTGRITPEQEAGVVDELARAKMDVRDQQTLLRSLRKDPYGAGVAEMITRGHLRDVEGYKSLLNMCKQGPSKADPKGMVPAAYMAMRLATELQEHGVARIGVELDTRTFDLDVYTRHPDGSIAYGYQLKDVNNINGISSAAEKASSQLTYEGIDHRVALLDIHKPMSDLTPRMFNKAEFLARKMNGTFLLRFTDGSLSVPPSGTTFP